MTPPAGKCSGQGHLLPLPTLCGRAGVHSVLDWYVVVTSACSQVLARVSHLRLWLPADAVVCQAYYNPVLTGTLELLVSAGDGTEIEDFMVDTQATNTPSRGSLAKPLIPPELEHIQRCALMRVPLPDGFEGERSRAAWVASTMPQLTHTPAARCMSRSDVRRVVPPPVHAQEHYTPRVVPRRVGAPRPRPTREPHAVCADVPRCQHSASWVRAASAVRRACSLVVPSLTTRVAACCGAVWTPCLYCVPCGLASASLRTWRSTPSCTAPSGPSAKQPRHRRKALAPPR